MRIWKFPLEVTDHQTILMPPRAQLLTVQWQNSICCVWALCDQTDESRERRHIAIYGTGNPIPDNPGGYIATFQMYDGALVFHAFEIAD